MVDRPSSPVDRTDARPPPPGHTADDFDALARERRHKRPAITHTTLVNAGSQSVVDKGASGGLSGRI